jgi:hypothetical protein
VPHSHCADTRAAQTMAPRRVLLLRLVSLLACVGPASASASVNASYDLDNSGSVSDYERITARVFDADRDGWLSEAELQQLQASPRRCGGGQYCSALELSAGAYEYLCQACPECPAGRYNIPISRGHTRTVCSACPSGFTTPASGTLSPINCSVAAPPPPSPPSTVWQDRYDACEQVTCRYNLCVEKVRTDCSSEQAACSAALGINATDSKPLTQGYPSSVGACEADFDSKSSDAWAAVGRRRRLAATAQLPAFGGCPASCQEHTDCVYDSIQVCGSDAQVRAVSRLSKSVCVQSAVSSRWVAGC